MGNPNHPESTSSGRSLRAALSGPTFDFVYSLGVFITFRIPVGGRGPRRALRPGGFFLAWVYMRTPEGSARCRYVGWQAGSARVIGGASCCWPARNRNGHRAIRVAVPGFRRPFCASRSAAYRSTRASAFASVGSTGTTAWPRPCPTDDAGSAEALLALHALRAGRDAGR